MHIHEIVVDKPWSTRRSGYQKVEVDLSRITSWLTSVAIEPSLDTGPVSSRTSPLKGSKTRGRPTPTVLIVDDEADMRLMLRHLLEFYGYRVVEAADGTEALRILSNAPSDAPVSVVITDLYMPGMDGIQLLRYLGSRRTVVQRVVAMSGVVHLGQRSMAAAASLLGADAVLDKPFSRHQLLRALAVAIDEGPPDPSRGLLS